MQKRKARTYLALILLPLLTSCLSERLTAYMEFVSQKSLASFHVDTPDPRLLCPPLGQRIFASWIIPGKEFYGPAPYHLKLTIRFGNRKEQVQWVRLNKHRGTHVYCLLDEAYFECQGVQTYKVELFKGDLRLDCWKHQLWAELIELNLSN